MMTVRSTPNNQRLSDQVASRLRQLMDERSLLPGEKLPSERELCTLLGVSRTVVREAVRSLAARGLLEVRQGGGTIVRTPDQTVLTDMMSAMIRGNANGVSFSHVMEVRRLLEIEIAGLAADRHTAEDLAQLTRHLDQLIARDLTAEQRASADVAFHAQLAVATQNPIYSVLLGSIAELLAEVRRVGFRLDTTPASAHNHHAAILERVRAHDRTGARRAMLAHLRESEITYQHARFAKDEG